MLLFNFEEFISEMREKEDKKEMINAYEAAYGPIQWDIYEQEWYKNYLANFDYVPYHTPEEMEDDFDRNLLQKLILGSMSTNYELANNPETNVPDLLITISDESQSITKNVADLWSFQILRLYEIYVEDHMSTQTMYKEEEDAIQNGETQSNAIQAERDMRLRKRSAFLATKDRAQLAEQTKVEQEQQLDDLMSQL